MVGYFAVLALLHWKSIRYAGGLETLVDLLGGAGTMGIIGWSMGDWYWGVGWGSGMSVYAETMGITMSRKGSIYGSACTSNLKGNIVSWKVASLDIWKDFVIRLKTL